MACTAHRASAVNKSWLDNTTSWNDPSNWSPAGVPLPGDNVFVGNLFAVENSFMNLNINDSVNALSITDGMTLQTSGNRLIVSTETVISGENQIGNVIYPSSISISRGALAEDFDTDFLTAEDNASVRLRGGGILEIDQSGVFSSTSRLSGGGVVNLNGNGPIVLEMNGRLDPTTDGMTINQLGTGVIDLDGSLGTGVIQASASKIDGTAFDNLTINGTALNDPYDGDISLVGGGFVDMNLSSGWTLGSGGEIRFGSSNSANPLPARLEGGNVSVNGDIIASGSNAHGQINANTTFNSGTNVTVGLNDRLELTQATVINAGTFDLEQGGDLDFDGATTVAGGTFNTFGTTVADGRVRFKGPSSWQGNVTVNGLVQTSGDATVTASSVVDAEVFDMDGTAGTNHEWNINNPITINADSIDTGNNRYDGTINTSSVLFGGALTVNLTNPSDSWYIDGTLNLPGNGLISATRIAGSPVVLAGTMSVGSGFSAISADTQISSTSAVSFASLTAQVRMTGETQVNAGATFNGFGTLRNTGTTLLDDGVNTNFVRVLNGGNLAIESGGAGEAEVNRFTNEASGTLLFEIGGTSSSDFDVLNVDAAAALGGALKVSFIDGFEPTLGQVFTILNAGNVTGQFSQILDNLAPNGVQLWPDYEPDLVRLIAVPELRCDLNLDGGVDAADAAVLFSNWATAGPGDLNFDGIVDAADAAVCFTEWTGDTIPVASVPEPHGLAGLCFGLALFAARIRRC